MAPDTDIQQADVAADRLSWTGRLSLTRRILLVNSVALLLLAGSFFYLDGMRKRLIAERLAQAESSSSLMGLALATVPVDQRNAS
jgi:two-component system, OmpR family, sensor histidine kinase ChvG